MIMKLLIHSGLLAGVGVWGGGGGGGWRWGGGGCIVYPLFCGVTFLVKNKTYGQSMSYLQSKPTKP